MIPLPDRSLASGLTVRHDTIVAVSSPPARSLRGLVRISGPDVLSILGGLLASPNAPLEGLTAWPQARQLVACRLSLPQDHTDETEPSRLDLPALIVLHLAPHSYTGQDMAEIQTPGNPSVLERVVDRVIALGGRRAEPGEFTFRSFLAGKLDLTQAEGVAATIAAVSDAQLQAAGMLREGHLGRSVSALATDIAQQLALVEAGIDFVDQDDVVTVTPQTLETHLERWSGHLDQLLVQSKSWEAIEALPRVVLVGAPNSGKSTLFNTLLGHDRAVTSQLANTTRDVLTQPLLLKGATGKQLEIMLVDIAGLIAPGDELSRASQAAAHEAIDRADLLLSVSDDPQRHPTTYHHAPVVWVYTKTDQWDPRSASNTDGQRQDGVAVSAIRGEGIGRLRTAIYQRLDGRASSVTGQQLVLQPRHEQALRQAQEQLAIAGQLLAGNASQQGLQQSELIATTLRLAIDELGALCGQLTPDEVLGRVFATFCIGK